jgi:molybdate transport system ATP-binding protein
MPVAELQVSARVASRGLDVEFTIAAGEVLGVLGPNGAGKSTTAAVIAGLVQADDAVVRVGNRTLTDTAHRVCVPTHDRRVGVLLQEPLLFPHMSVIANVMFGARRHADRSMAGHRAQRWLAEVGAEGLADRKPGELSGGQAQRVALARALAAEPEVLLLDEPLAGLDVAGAASVRAVLRTVLATDGRAALLITHDLIDVLTLADRVMILEAGKVVEVGPVAEVLTAPRSAFGARIAGVNLVRGVLAEPGALRDASELVWHGIPAEDLPVGRDVVAVFSPGGVAVYRDRPHGSPRNSVRVRIAALEVNGSVVRIRADEQDSGTAGLAADITPDAVVDLGLQVGDTVWFTVKTQAVGLHPAAGHT